MVWQAQGVLGGGSGDHPGTTGTCRDGLVWAQEGKKPGDWVSVEHMS